MHQLIIQATYDELQIGLCDQEEVIDRISEDKRDASKTILIRIDTLLRRNKCALHNLNFIGVNQGPAPFTSLRVGITISNGISYAINIPLISINGLEAFVQEYTDAQYPYTIALLNAFNNTVYVAIEKKGIIEKISWQSLESLLQEISLLSNTQQIRLIGNGVTLYLERILHYIRNNKNIYIPQPIPQFVSLDQLAKSAWNEWLQKRITNQVLPLYLKEAV